MLESCFPFLGFGFEVISSTDDFALSALLHIHWVTKLMYTIVDFYE